MNCKYFLICFSFLLFGCKQNDAEKNSSFNSSYTKIYDSLFGGEMKFLCGRNVFKIKKQFVSNPKLFWKSEHEWVELKKVKFESAGFEFEGLGSNSGVEKSKLKIDIDLPVYSGSSFRINSNKPIDYFEVVESNEFIPYKYSVDIYSQIMELYNLTDIHTYLQLNDKKYRDENGAIDEEFQVLNKPITEFMIETYKKNIAEYKDEMKRDHSGLYADLERRAEKNLIRAEEENEKYKKQQADKKTDQIMRLKNIEDNIKKYSKPIVVVTEANKNKEMDYCHLIE